jgi:predicted HTH domain antitoxin
MRLAAAVKWYELGLVSQSKASEIAGISREAFLSALYRFRVTPFQYSVDDLVNESKT